LGISARNRHREKTGKIEKIRETRALFSPKNLGFSRNITNFTEKFRIGQPLSHHAMPSAIALLQYRTTFSVFHPQYKLFSNCIV